MKGKAQIFAGYPGEDALPHGETTLARGPLDCEEWSAGAFACLRDWLAPELVGRSLASGEKLQEALRTFQGNTHAKAALDAEVSCRDGVVSGDREDTAVRIGCRLVADAVARAASHSELPVGGGAVILVEPAGRDGGDLVVLAGQVEDTG